MFAAATAATATHHLHHYRSANTFGHSYSACIQSARLWWTIFGHEYERMLIESRFVNKYTVSVNKTKAFTLFRRSAPHWKKKQQQQKNTHTNFGSSDARDNNGHLMAIQCWLRTRWQMQRLVQCCSLKIQHRTPAERDATVAVTTQLCEFAHHRDQFGGEVVMGRVTHNLLSVYPYTHVPKLDWLTVCNVGMCLSACWQNMNR